MRHTPHHLNKLAKIQFLIPIALPHVIQNSRFAHSVVVGDFFVGEGEGRVFLEELEGVGEGEVLFIKKLKYGFKCRQIRLEKIIHIQSPENPFPPPLPHLNPLPHSHFNHVYQLLHRHVQSFYLMTNNIFLISQPHHNLIKLVSGQIITRHVTQLFGFFA